MFILAWLLLSVAAYVTWTVFLWVVSVSGGEPLRRADIGYERAVLDTAHRFVAWTARRAKAVLVR